MQRSVIFFLVLLAATQSGCSLVLADDITQCQTDADCSAKGAAAATTVCQANRCVASEPAMMTGWECLGKLEPIRTDAKRSVNLNLRLTDLKTSGLTGLAVNYCYSLDPACTPINAEDAYSDADGQVSLEVPWGLHGIVIITGDANIVPTLVYIDPPPTAPTNAITIPILDVDTVALMSLLTGKLVDPETGMVLLSTSDCTLQYNPLTPGVSYELDSPGENTVQFYLVNQQPDTSATQTGANSVGGFANVPPGLALISARVPELDNLAVGHGNFLVRKGWLTYATISPFDQ